MGGKDESKNKNMFFLQDPLTENAIQENYHQRKIYLNINSEYISTLQMKCNNNNTCNEYVIPELCQLPQKIKEIICYFLKCTRSLLFCMISFLVYLLWYTIPTGVHSTSEINFHCGK